MSRHIFGFEGGGSPLAEGMVRLYWQEGIYYNISGSHDIEKCSLHFYRVVNEIDSVIHTELNEWFAHIKNLRRWQLRKTMSGRKNRLNLEHLQRPSCERNPTHDDTDALKRYITLMVSNASKYCDVARDRD